MIDSPNIEIGNNTENYVAQELSKLGAIVLNMNRSNTGSQPYDQVAITKSNTWCYDVKHSKQDRFDFSRVETNQSIALEFTHNLHNDNVIVGFAIVYNDIIYFLSFHNYLIEKSKNKKVYKNKHFITTVRGV